MAGQSSSQAASPFQWWKPALFFLVVIVGLWYVKWQPYYGKAFTAAETHSIGKSILAQADANPLMAAWDYAMVYFLAVWKAAVLGVLLGSLIQVLIPRDWLLRTLGQSRFQGTLLGAIFSLPGMMCTCCAAPVAAGMRKQRVSMGGALAFWMGNPLLNPATLVFMGFVLGWQFALTLAAQAILFPYLFRHGVEKARLYMMIFFVVLLALVAALAGLAGAALPQGSILFLLGAPAALVLALLLCLASVPLSVRQYVKRLG